MEEGTPATAPAGTEEAAPPERKRFRLARENTCDALASLRGLPSEETAELLDDVTAHVLELLRFRSDVDELAAKMPENVGEALTQLNLARHAANGAARRASEAHNEWAARDLLSPRIREECVAELVASGMTATAAKTAASAPPQYTAHRDMVAVLEAVRNMAALELSTAERDFVAAYASAELVCSAARSAPMAFLLAAAPAPPPDDPERMRFTGSGKPRGEAPH